MKICSMVAAMVVGHVVAALSLEDNLQVDMLYLVNVDEEGRGVQFDTVDVFMAYDNGAGVSPRVTVVPDVSRSSIVMNRYKEQGWGVKCNESESRGGGSDGELIAYCNIQRDELVRDVYMGMKYEYFPAETPLLLKEEHLDQIDLVPKVLFNLGNDLDPSVWSYKKTGVLGLSPSQTNPLWAHLFRTYVFKGNRITFNLNYKAGDLSQRFNPRSRSSFSNSHMTINGFDGRNLGKKGLYYVDQHPESDHWTLPSVYISIVDSKQRTTEIERGHACITNNYHDLMAMDKSKSISLTKQIALSMCGKDDCGTLLDYEKAPKLTFSIELEDGDTLRYTLNPEAYVYVDNNHTKLSIGDLNEWKTTNSCGKIHSIAFGRLFFLSSFIVFEVEKKLKAKVYLGEIRKSAKISSEERMVLTLFICVCICVLAIFGVYTMKYRYKDSGLLPDDSSKYDDNMILKYDRNRVDGSGSEHEDIHKDNFFSQNDEVLDDEEKVLGRDSSSQEDAGSRQGVIRKANRQSL